MHGVKRTDNTLEAPGFTRFLQQQAGFRKKSVAEFRFVHACCIHTHIALMPPLEVEAPRHIKTAAGLPNGDSNVSPGTLFTDAQALENNVKVANPLASRQ
jgi:hypothetical protein